MKVRPHRGSFVASMREAVDIEPKMEALQAHIEFPIVSVNPYYEGGAHIIICRWPDGVDAPWGWTDGPLP